VSERILFLDVDGVLNHEQTFLNRVPNMLETINVARLNRLCERVGASIVLSSAWRMVPGLERKLREAGALRFRRETDWRTKRSYDATPGGITIAGGRGEEISEWLSRHPEVTAYAIVDDEAHDIVPLHEGHFVKTDFRAGGLLDEHCEALAAIFLPPTEDKET
jgi:hypothetical protein